MRRPAARGVAAALNRREESIKGYQQEEDRSSKYLLTDHYKYPMTDYFSPSEVRRRQADRVASEEKDSLGPNPSPARVLEHMASKDRLSQTGEDEGP